ncbi:MAG TPA: M28 family peptidase [Longimicrobiales bacterium]|nr:M28 family peptidase [Longimicrobiales bacterium]
MDLRGFGLSDDDLRQLGYDIEKKSGSDADAGRARPGRQGREAEGPVGEVPATRRWAPATRMWMASLLVLTATAWMAGSGRWLPDPAPVAAPDTEFSSGRALAELVEVARGPRPTGSPEGERVRGYLLGRLRSLGLEAEVRTATSFVRDAAFVRSATVRNVVARVPGTEPTGTILLTAHYDTQPHSPAAGGSGRDVATVLEVVRALRAGPPLRNDVTVLLSDADELGRLGARAYAADERSLSEVAIVLSPEARGVAGPAVWFETGVENGRLVQMLAAAEPRPAALSLARVVRTLAVESADSDALLREGVPGVTLATLGDAALQHQPGDRRERVSEASLQHAGRQLLALTRSLGGLDLRSELTGADRVYVSLPRMGAVHYPRGWVFLTTLALLACGALAGLVLHGRRATRRGVGVGVAAGAAAVAAPAMLGRTLRDMAIPLHPEVGTLHTAFYEDGPYVLAVVALALASGSVIYAVAKRWARSDELVFGGLLVPLAYVCWLSVAEPFAAPALQLPLGAALLGGALVIGLGPYRARTVWAWGALLLLAALALVLAVPSVELLAAVWTFRSATWIGAVAGLGVLLLWPLMERLIMPRMWWTPLAGVGVAASLVGLTLPGLRDLSEHPVPTTLVYLTDEPVLPSLAGTAAAASAPDSARVRSMAGKWLTVPGPGEVWARSWAGEAATGQTHPGVLLIGADTLFEVIGTAPVSELAPPRVTVTSVTEDAGGRRVELAVRPGLSGEMTGIHIPEGAPASIVGVGDATWQTGNAPVRSLVHWGAPATPELHIGVELPAAASELTLVVLEHSLRPRQVIGSYFFQRADSLVANVATGSDRAIQRTRLRVPLVDPGPVGP